RIIILLNNITEEELQHTYITHLCDNIAVEVRRAKPQNFAQAIEAAQRAEAILRPSKGKGRDYSNGNQSTFNWQTMPYYPTYNVSNGTLMELDNINVPYGKPNGKNNGKGKGNGNSSQQGNGNGFKQPKPPKLTPQERDYLWSIRAC